jgi:hypothetical protein
MKSSFLLLFYVVPPTDQEGQPRVMIRHGKRDIALPDVNGVGR